MQNKQTHAAILYGLAAVLFWSTVASAFKLSLRSYNYIQLLLIANISSLAGLTILLITTGKIKQITSGLSWTNLLKSALYGFINPFVYYLILFKAYSLLPAQIAQPINFSWPIVLTLLSFVFLKEKYRPRSLIALMISFSGVVLVSTQGDLREFNIQEPLGIFLCLSSAIIWSFYWILNMKDNREVIIKLFFNFLFSFLYILLLSGLTGNLSFEKSLKLFWPVYVGLFEMGITFYFWMQALKFARNTAQISNLIYLTPIFSLLLINLILKEEIHLTTVFGLGLIIAGILFQRKV